MLTLGCKPYQYTEKQAQFVEENNLAGSPLQQVFLQSPASAHLVPPGLTRKTKLIIFVQQWKNVKYKTKQLIFREVVHFLRVQVTYAIPFRTTQHHLICNKIPSVCLADFHIVVALFWNFFPLFQFTWSHTPESSHIFIFVAYKNYFCHSCWTESKAVSFPPSNRSIFTSGMWAPYWLSIKRLIFKPAMKQTDGATLEAECLCSF